MKAWPAYCSSASMPAAAISAKEEANAVLLLVEQLAITLDNSRLIADRLLAERRAGPLEKLSALGLMSSAIAHEIKNPLSAVKTIATVLQENLGPDSPHAEDVAVIRGEIDRLAATTQQLLAFARPDPISDRPVAVVPARSCGVRLRFCAGSPLRATSPW